MCWLPAAFFQLTAMTGSIFRDYGIRKGTHAFRFYSCWLSHYSAASKTAEIHACMQRDGRVHTV